MVSTECGVCGFFLFPLFFVLVFAGSGTMVEDFYPLSTNSHSPETMVVNCSLMQNDEVQFCNRGRE